ncbi:MAG: hypothetical protein IKL24_04465 [Clostridia bacterium]|nr:hypothetical protein [Clostridia bacterium]
MKQEAKNLLIRHIVIAAVAWTAAAVVFMSLASSGVILGILAGLMCAGVPFAWKWLSGIFISLSIYTLVIKLVLSIFLGWIALPIVIVKDIYCVVTAA